MATPDNYHDLKLTSSSSCKIYFKTLMAQRKHSKSFCLKWKRSCILHPRLFSNRKRNLIPYCISDNKAIYPPKNIYSANGLLFIHRKNCLMLGDIMWRDARASLKCISTLSWGRLESFQDMQYQFPLTSPPGFIISCLENISQFSFWNRFRSCISKRSYVAAKAAENFRKL